MTIEIRRTEPSDVMSVADIYSNLNACHQTLQLPHPSFDLWEKRLSNIPDNVYSYVALIDGIVVGNLGFVVNENPRRRHTATFVMAVKDDYTGQGVGSALMETIIDLSDHWLNLKRIELTVYVDNKSAISLYKKYGFKIEGEMVDFAFRNGEYVSAYQMGRINKST